MTRIRRRSSKRRFGPRRWSPTTVVLLLLVLAVSRLWQSSERSSVDFTAESATAFVERVVDGDTLLLSGGPRVRLIGVDTPETKHPNRPPEPFGQEAYELTRRLVEGREVRLEFDRERYDRYQRVLAYVYVDSIFLNEELVRAGLARAQTQYPYRSDMKRRFLQAQEQARERGIGIWTMTDVSTSGHGLR